MKRNLVSVLVIILSVLVVVCVTVRGKGNWQNWCQPVTLDNEIVYKHAECLDNWLT